MDIDVLVCNELKFNFVGLQSNTLFALFLDLVLPVTE